MCCVYCIIAIGDKNSFTGFLQDNGVYTLVRETALQMSIEDARAHVAKFSKEEQGTMWILYY